MGLFSHNYTTTKSHIFHSMQPYTNFFQLKYAKKEDQMAVH